MKLVAFEQIFLKRKLEEALSATRQAETYEFDLIELEGVVEECVEQQHLLKAQIEHAAHVQSARCRQSHVLAIGVVIVKFLST